METESKIGLENIQKLVNCHAGSTNQRSPRISALIVPADNSLC